jgi:hypothetical protein
MIYNYDKELFQDVTISSVLLLFWYYIVNLILPSYNKIKERDDYSIWIEKRLSWILTLLSAIIALISFAYYLVAHNVHLLWNINNFYLELTTHPHNFISTVYGENRISAFSIRFFCSYFLLDTIFMYFYYRKISNFMSWAHHIGYLIVMAYSLYYKISMIFLIFFPIEISTLFLASGKIWSTHRFNLIFGITFFAFRIIYHGFLVYLLLKNFDLVPHKITALGACLSLIMHIQWWYNWFRSFLSIKKQY